MTITEQEFTELYNENKSNKNTLNMLESELSEIKRDLNRNKNNQSDYLKKYINQNKILEEKIEKINNNLAPLTSMEQLKEKCLSDIKNNNDIIKNNIYTDKIKKLEETIEMITIDIIILKCHIKENNDSLNSFVKDHFINHCSESYLRHISVDSIEQLKIMISTSHVTINSKFSGTYYCNFSGNRNINGDKFSFNHVIEL